MPRLAIASFAILLCLASLSAHSAEAQPARDLAAAERLLPLLDLERPELAEVKALANQGKQVPALHVWRDLLVNRMRRLDYHEFYQHDYSRHPRQVGVADMLTGVVSREDYLRDASATGFLDIFGMAGPPDRDHRVNWFAQPEDVADWGNPEINAWSIAKKRSVIDYGCLHFGRSFVARYWETGNPAYRDKILCLMHDLAVNHRRLFWEAYARGEVHARNREASRLYYTDWRQNVNALDTAVRARNFVVFQAGLAKCLGTDKPTEWGAILRPLGTPLAREQAAALPADQMADLAVSLVEHHAPKVVWFVSGPSVPNQRLAGLKTLLTLAYTYPGFRHAADLLAAFEIQMEAVLADNYLPDGGNLEQSFNYNHGELRELQTILDFFGDDPPPFAQRIQQRIAARRAMDDGLRTPLGGLPQVGNHSDVTATGKDTWSSPEAIAAYRAYRQRAGALAEPVPQAYLSKDYPFSGYYAMRGGWSWDSPYLFFMAGRPQSGHAMHDSNSVQVTALGRHFVVCDGAPTYGFRHTPETEYAAEAVDEHCGWKVNTVLVDGMCQARDSQRYSSAPQTPVPLRWHTSDEFDFIENLCDRGYWRMREPHGKPDHSVAHRRRVVFLREEGFWLLEDRMERTDDTQRTYSQVWNFPPRLQNRQDYARKQIDGFDPGQFSLDADAKRFATADPDGPNLAFVHVVPGPLRYRLFHGDRAELKGWFAPGLGSLCAAPDVHAEWRSADSDRLVTLLLPEAKGAPATLPSLEREEGPGWFGFSASLRTGGRLAYRTAAIPLPLSVGPVSATATGLFVREKDGVLTGFATGAETLSVAGREVPIRDSHVRFVHRDGRTDCVSVPLQRSPRIAPPPPFLPGEPVPPATIAGEDGFAIHYTVDGSLPDPGAARYTGPIALPHPAPVKACYVRQGEALPFVAVRDYLPTDRRPRPADLPLTFRGENGLHCAEIRHGPTRIYDLMLQPPARTVVRSTWRLEDYAKETDFGLRQTCLLRIPTRGFWRFHLRRGEAATAALAICNPETDLPARPLARVGWWAEEETGNLPLEAGYHRLEIQYGCFYNTRNGLNIEIEGPGTPRQPLPDSWLYLLP